MKKMLVVSFIIAGSILGNACNKSSIRGHLNFGISAKINGVAFYHPYPTCYFHGSSSSNMVSISDSAFTYPALIPADHYIEFFMYNIGTGVYEIGGPHYIIVHLDSAMDTTIYHSNPAAYGTIDITYLGTYIEGTFSFTCSDSTKVSDGIFKCKVTRN